MARSTAIASPQLLARGAVRDGRGGGRGCGGCGVDVLVFTTNTDHH